MPDLASDAKPEVPRSQGQVRATPGAAAGHLVMRLRRPWFCAAAAGVLLSLAACGTRTEAGPTGGVTKSSNAMEAQRYALEHCRKYGKGGRVTGPIGEETYSFVCD